MDAFDFVGIDREEREEIREKIEQLKETDGITIEFEEVSQGEIYLTVDGGYDNNDIHWMEEIEKKVLLVFKHPVIDRDYVIKVSLR